MDYDYDGYDTELQSDGEYTYQNDDEDAYDYLTWQQMISTCILPTLSQTASSLISILVWNLVFRMSTQLTYLPASLKHLLSLLCGLLCLRSLFPTFFVLLIPLPVFSYLPLLANAHRGLYVLALSLVYLVWCEVAWLDPRVWHQIRGPQMILVMKAVSLGFDLDIGTVRCVPNLLQYSAFMFCPGSCVMGPWTSYMDYMNLYSTVEKMRRYWIWPALRSLMFSAMFLLSSTCFVNYLLPDTSWKWLLAYRDALSFRCSHYFISYVSEATMLLSGYTNTWNEDGVTVAKPLNIELPRSLIQVVVSWNIPMHSWLKVYVFNTTRWFGHFVAVLSTYVVSSLLHGLNFQLAAVLLSLGIYSYVEFMLRKKLANAFNACVLARSCKQGCGHEYTWKYPGVLLTNFTFSCITVMHLAYLGVMFDNSEGSNEGYSYSHTLYKWSHLGFFSHWFALACYIFYFLI